MERDLKDKFADLQSKSELAVRNRELEIKEELDVKNKQIKARFSSELQKAHEMIKEREQEIDEMEHQIGELAQEKARLEENLQKAESQVLDFQSDTGAQITNMQGDFAQRISQLTEELNQSKQSCETLKNVVDQREQELLSKGQLEDQLDAVKADCQALTLANDEYRRHLKTKNVDHAAALQTKDSQLKSLTLQKKELELALSHEQTKTKRLLAENGEMLD